MRPDFLVIGAPKAGTTALCHNLGQHPDVFVSDPKEPFFFSNDDVYARGMDWYESLFRDGKDRAAVGEGSTTYSVRGVHPATVDRILDALPDVRILYQVRDPIERMRSHWIELAAQGLTMLPFDRAVREVPEIVDASRFWYQLAAYRERLPDERILLLFFEDYRADPNAVLARCFAFLGVDPKVRIAGAERPRHTSSGRRSDRPITNWLRRNVPGFGGLRRHAPARVRRAAKMLLKRPIERKPDWSPETHAWAVERVRDDAHRLLEFAGKPLDFWPLR